MLSEKSYENIIIKNDKFTEDTLIALGLVKKYIQKHKLIIVGGMAIDMALKLKGTKLYSDDVLPDYDFYSPHHHVDAYNIAEKLHTAGLSNISVINANHTSTMRVRVNYTVVADVTYIPKNIFDTIPRLIYRDLLIIHPHFQMIDQHRSLSLPFENPPWEVITHRWKKDAKRYDIIYKYYPLKLIVNKKIQLKPEIKISSVIFKNQCLSGFVGLLYWREIAKKYKFKTSINENIGSIEIDSVGMVVTIPEDSNGISIYSNNIKSLYNKIKNNRSITKERMYERFLDKLPFKVILDNEWEILDNACYMLSSHKLDNGIYVSNLQNIMLYMLTNYIILNKIKNTTRGYTFYIGYLMAQELVRWAGIEYSKNPNKNFKKFLPTVEVYGDMEISDSYLNSKRMFLEQIKELPKRQLQPKIIFPDTFVKNKIPKSYYDFDASKS